MNSIEIFMVGVGLSMDAAAVSMGNGMIFKQMNLRKSSLMASCYGIAQGMMLFLGYELGCFFAQIIFRYAGIIVCLILGVIGLKMMKEGIFGEEEFSPKGRLSIVEILLQVIATSIDAFAVGIGFSMLQVNMLQSTSIVGVVTFFMSLFAILIGQKFGNLLGNKAVAVGGFILIVIGIRGL